MAFGHGRVSFDGHGKGLGGCPKKSSSEYQLYACGNFPDIPRFWKKLLFSDSLLNEYMIRDSSIVEKGASYVE